MEISRLSKQQAHYAELLVRVGVNLQPGQSMRVSAELVHRQFVRYVVEAAYDAGAQYVHVDYLDEALTRSRLLHSDPAHLDYMPAYEVARHQQMLDEGWCRLSLVGSEFPDILDEVDPGRIRQISAARMKHLKFYMQAVMTNRLQWCVAAVPTPAWAQKVFPDLPVKRAEGHLWRVVLQTCRMDQPDPAAAWQQHDQRLKHITQFLQQRQVRTLHFQDPTPGPDGRASTDLRVGLTDLPAWVGGSSHTPRGVRFIANMPTEEVFSTPHRARVDGWVRTSKPAFPFDRRVENAYFRFTAGHVVEYGAETGQDVLAQFFEIEGTTRLGEVSLVDVRSPIHRSGLLFHETLFDENAVCHIAFGDAYAEGVEGGDAVSEEQLRALGVNSSDAHEDFMIGTETMNVTGICADGTQVAIMRSGQFTAEVLDADSAPAAGAAA